VQQKGEAPSLLRRRKPPCGFGSEGASALRPVAAPFWCFLYSFLDNDNLVKPIQDALNGLVYCDDSQVTDTVIRKTNLYQNFFIENQSEILLSALRHRSSFVHVQVSTAPDHRRLL
jgi:hypothetical protein